MHVSDDGGEFMASKSFELSGMLLGMGMAMSDSV